MDESGGRLFAVAPAGVLPPRMMSREIRHNGVTYNAAPAPLVQTAAFMPPTHYGPGSTTLPGGQGSALLCSSLQQPTQTVNRMMMLRSPAYPAVTTPQSADGAVGQKQLPDELARNAQQALPGQTYTSTWSSTSVTLSHSSTATEGERYLCTTMADTSVASSAPLTQHTAHTTAATVNATSTQMPISSSSPVQSCSTQQCVQPDDRLLPCSEVNSVSPVKNGVTLKQPLDRIDSTVAAVGSVVKLEPKTEMEASESIESQPVVTSEDVKLEVKSELLKHETESEAVASEETTDSKVHLLLSKEHLSLKHSDAAADDEPACHADSKKEPSRKGMY